MGIAPFDVNNLARELYNLVTVISHRMMRRYGGGNS
jgi:uncharacterized protein YjeT (DUF2065 family)